jgi:glyoxylase-like metal-dependent hydrolase (beta-lactamase superfamily II)
MQRFRELTPGVLVATEKELTTTSTAVAHPGGGSLLIDPALTPADLAGLAAELAGAGLTPLAGFATHPHWDHVLWSRELGDVPRYASAASAAAAEAEHRDLAESARNHTADYDWDLFGRLTALPDGTGLVPWDGPEAQLIVHNGHAPGHAAVFLPDSGVLVAGDMLSDLEIPILDTELDNAFEDYVAGLDLLAAVRGVRWLVPGHGQAGDTAEFRRRVDLDQRYLDRLAAGQPFDDPRGLPGWLADQHRQQSEYVLARSGRSAPTAPAGARRAPPPGAARPGPAWPLARPGAGARFGASAGGRAGGRDLAEA